MVIQKASSSTYCATARARWRESEFPTPTASPPLSFIVLSVMNERREGRVKQPLVLYFFSVVISQPILAVCPGTTCTAAQMEHRGARRRRAWPWRARLPFLSACLVCILGTEPAPGGDADRFPCQTHQDCGQSRARRAAVVPRARRDCERMRLRCARRLTGGVELPSPFVLAQATPPFAVRKSAACRKGLQ